MRLSVRPADGDSEVADVAAFDAGMAEGLDPQEERGAHGDQALTHVSSPWNHRLCGTCGHSFRRGDRVRLGSGAADVVHLDRGPGCGAAGGPGPGAAADPDAVAEFGAGLLEAWPPLDGVPVEAVAPGDPRIADRSRHGARPPKCLYCGHTFRPHEWVVRCPCRPDRPVCRASVHRDPASGLVCWESWKPGGRVEVCPVTLTPVPPPDPADGTADGTGRWPA
ncbi:hypothetical protein GCM10009639_24420 [Kitasatospora putterlickiae]|uniref:Uncharacterized protein n=1 Tax=Kitasatospora putterlickiae TaxID=221725 RepID=A0ABN1Y037_9ACTN